MDNRTPRHRHTPSDPRSHQRNVIDGRPIPRRRSSDPASSASDGYFDRSRISADDAARVSRNTTQKGPQPDPSRRTPDWAKGASGQSQSVYGSAQPYPESAQAYSGSAQSYSRPEQSYPRSVQPRPGAAQPYSGSAQTQQRPVRRQQGAQSQQGRSTYRREHAGRYSEPFTDQPNEAPAYQEPLENQPSWYDPNRAERSATPRATLDTSLENPRWYSRNENDVYVGARHSFGGSRGQGKQSASRYGGENSYGSRSSSFTNRGLSFSASGHTRSKLPFFIGGGIVVLVLLIVLIVNVVNALATPQQSTQEETLPVAESAPTQTSFTISFAGDCTLGTDSSFDPSTSFTAMYNDVDDPAYFMKNVASIFGSDDYTVVNMEGTLTESDSRQDKTYAFKGPAEYTEILKSGNIEAASLANNHSRDYGEQSYTDTIEALDAAGITNFGYDRIAYADVKGVKVALIGTYMLAEGLDIKDEMITNINTAKNEGAQVIIVFTHWGVEKETVPEADQVELGHAAIDAGATIVVGSHPHVIQGYEKYNGRYIVYSLGNFCFGGNKNPSDKDCMIFQQTFTVTGNDVATDDAINVIPCSISSSSSSNNYQPTPAEGEEADRIKAKIEESNESIAALSAEVSGASQSNNSGSDANNTDEASA